MPCVAEARYPGRHVCIIPTFSGQSQYEANTISYVAYKAITNHHTTLTTMTTESNVLPIQSKQTHFGADLFRGSPVTDMLHFSNIKIIIISFEIRKF
jgi:hypothetical protein